MTATRQLVLIRHGQSTWNVERRVQGQRGEGLSDLGARQAELTAAAVAEAYPDAQLFTSDLQRCLETAAPLERRLRTDAELDRGLRERDFAAWSGLLLPEIAEGWPELWDQWRAGVDVVGDIGGESSPQLALRVSATLRGIVDRADPARPVVCVTHGGPVWYGTHALAGLPHGTLGAVGNASLTRLEVEGDGTVRLGSWNEVGHLPPGQRSHLQPTGHAQRSAPPVGR